jgi:hypothetical protein
MSNANLIRKIGYDPKACRATGLPEHVVERINLNLAALGEPIFGKTEDYPALMMSQNLVAHFRAKNELMKDGLRPPVDLRIEKFLKDYLAELDEPEVHLPGKTYNLSQHGIARALSLPADGDSFKNDIIESYRLVNGVLHNPVNDRRTTKGVFHVAEGGLPIPEDKKSVPKVAFARLLQAALCPPDELTKLPFTANQEEKAHIWVSLLLRPVICPEVPGFVSEKSMEVRFFAPGSMAANLDFVESIFGNAGDPFLPENDAGLDIDHWSGTSGCVILAPHIKGLTKKALGLPNISEATDRQKRDSMCWEKEDELYNDGGAFNANLYGLCEEEHAGGTLAFSSYDLGEDFRLSNYIKEEVRSFASVMEDYGDQMEIQPEGHAVDTNYSNVIYLPENAVFSLPNQSIEWEKDGESQAIKLLSGRIYLYPNGYKVRLVKPAEGRRWRLIGTVPEGTNCHKPCTVSGGGKSEISKSIADAIIHAPFYIGNLKKDFDAVERILARDYQKRFVNPEQMAKSSRPILSGQRSLGSVIKLLTPHPEYTSEHNAFVRDIPTHIKELVLLLKRFYKDDWGDNWRERFSVNIINGISGHELKYRNNKIISSYLRVGYDDSDAWRVFSLRKDFFPAEKIQTEDDITASVVVPWDKIPAEPGKSQGGIGAKVIRNCEYRLFQRPDDAIVRGYDKQTELDMSRPNNFFSNYAPLEQSDIREMVDDAVRFDYFTDPMKQLLGNFVENPETHPAYIVSSSNPRIVDGKPTKNPRYLQNVGTLEKPVASYVAEMGARFKRKLKKDEAAIFPVNGFLPGRRNNPPEGPIRSLAVFNPVHFLPLPEAFMEFTSSMTGKSPSTTGAGSEGALTKGPFNALMPITDLNNALVAAVLTGLNPFITAAGYVGPNFRVDHDISLLVPEVWCRMRRYERDPEWLIENKFLEPVPAYDHDGKALPTGLLGYRINQAFVNYFLGRIFTSPEMLFTEGMLKPELQSMEIFADGLDNIMTTHRVVAENYFKDGSIELACPPMKALLHIMRDGHYEGKGLDAPEVRDLFKAETILKSDWYAARLKDKQAVDIRHWEKVMQYLNDSGLSVDGLDVLRESVQARVDTVKADDYVDSLHGTIGRDTAF